VAFVAPSFVMVVLLALLYVRFGGMPWLEGAFYGIGAAVIAIIARSAVNLARSSLGRDRLLWALFALSAVVTIWLESEMVWLFVLCGVVTMVVRTPTRLPGSGAAGVVIARLTTSAPWRTAEGIAGSAAMSLPAALFLFFASAGLFVFGSGLAIVPFLHAGVVQQHHWLTERQFLDAVAVALITPGPVVITVAFIGYLVAGVPGAFAAAAGVFAPVYVITVFLAPHFARLRTNMRVRAFVDGVTAAATGAIAGAAVVLGRRSVFDGPTLSIAALTLVLLQRRVRPPDPVVILLAGAVGVMIKRSLG
jgi:chromate transporter